MTKQLKIFILGNASTIHVQRRANYLAEMGHAVHVFSYEFPGTDENLADVNVHILRRRSFSKSKVFNFMFNIPSSLSQIRAGIRETQPDILHAQYIASYGVLAAFLNFHPLVFTAWGSDILVTPRKNFFVKVFIWYALRKADFIICSASHMKKAIMDFKIPDEKVKIINFGIDTRKFFPGPKDDKIIKTLNLKEKKVIIALKWPDPVSNYETLIKAAKVVVKGNPEARFLVLGPSSYPDYLKSLKEMVGELGISEEFRFLGPVPGVDVKDYLNTADVYVSTSISDGGFAISTSEAMACGLPVVITDFGCNKDWVKDGENGFLFSSGDYQILAKKIAYLLNDENMRKKLVLANEKLIEEKSSYTKEIEENIKIYKNLIDIKRPERKYQICKKCIMDTTDPEIKFDENGACNHCKEYEKHSQYLFSEKELLRIIEKIKKDGKGKKYDCVMGVSGGVDSCMSAYLAKKYGLNPLAVHVDNGWNSEISQSNIEKIMKKLGIDLYTHVIDWEEFKDLQIAFLKASVANIDYPYDHAITAIMFNKAAEMGLKYIIYGTNIKTEFIMPKEWGYNSWDLKHLNAIYKKFGKKGKIKTLPTVSLFKLFYYSIFKKIRIFRILDYMDYNKEKAKEFLKNELEWQDYGVKHSESIYTRFFLGYVLPKKFGFDRNRAWLSTLILSGQLTRGEALKELEKGFYSSQKEMEDDKEYVIKKLGISNNEFERIMNDPPKNHRDYPNNALFLDRSGVFIGMARRILRKF